jgi:acetyl esterase/lipase
VLIGGSARRPRRRTRTVDTIRSRPPPVSDATRSSGIPNVIRSRNPPDTSGASAGSTRSHANSAGPPRCTARMVVITGSDDHVVTAPQRDALAARLAAEGVTHQMLVIDGAPHAFLSEGTPSLSRRGGGHRVARHRGGASWRIRNTAESSTSSMRGTS